MDDVAILLEHVDLFDRLDGLDVHLLQSCLKLLVVHSRSLVDLLDFPPRRALATVIDSQHYQVSVSLHAIEISGCVDVQRTIP